MKEPVDWIGGLMGFVVGSGADSSEVAIVAELAFGVGGALLMVAEVEGALEVVFGFEIWGQDGVLHSYSIFGC